MTCREELSNRGMAGFRLTVLLVIAAISTAAAQSTYTVNLHPELNGLDVKIETVESASMLVVNLTNNSAGKVRCSLRYEASPQVPYRTTTYVAPGKTESSIFRAQRKWFTVDVTVRCEPSDK